MEVVAYIRVSTEKQTVENQRLAILSFAQKEKIQVDRFEETIVSSRNKSQRKNFDEFISLLNAGDLLIVSELSRVGRSLGVIIEQINNLLEKKIDFIAIKENIRLVGGKQDLQSKMMITMFGLFAEVERDLISERTKEGLARAKKAGKKIGRPKGRKSKSKLDGKESEIAMYLDKKVSKASIARILDVSPTTLKHFIKTRKLEAGDLLRNTL